MLIRGNMNRFDSPNWGGREEGFRIFSFFFTATKLREQLLQNNSNLSPIRRMEISEGDD